jgi:hypothetical protein
MSNRFTIVFITIMLLFVHIVNLRGASSPDKPDKDLLLESIKNL